MNLDKLWRQYNTFRLRKAKQHYPRIYKALKAQLQHFAENRNIDLIPIAPIAEAIRAIYLDAGRLWAHNTYINVMTDAGLRKNIYMRMETKGRMPIGYNEDFINSILQYFQLRLLNEAVLPISETTKDIIRNALNDGIQQGKSLDEIVAEILNSDITKVRAEMIARTEVMKAANMGEQLGTDKTGLQTNKVWISVRDHRTRHDHINVDNQVVPDGRPFNVGGYLMQRPGDGTSEDGRKVPAKEIVNCRCVVGRKVLRGANGLPLKR